MINKEKFFYGKCPNCHKHGIQRFFKIGKIQNFKLTCKYCNKCYKVNRFFSLTMYFLVFITEVMLVKLYNHIYNYAEFPTFFVIITVFIAITIINIFAPLEECDKSSDTED